MRFVSAYEICIGNTTLHSEQESNLADLKGSIFCVMLQCSQRNNVYQRVKSLRILGLRFEITLDSDFLMNKRGT